MMALLSAHCTDKFLSQYNQMLNLRNNLRRRKEAAL
jgi:hypothetical protein